MHPEAVRISGDREQRRAEIVEVVIDPLRGLRDAHQPYVTTWGPCSAPAVQSEGNSSFAIMVSTVRAERVYVSSRELPLSSPFST